MHPLLRRLFPFAQVPQAGAKGGNPDDFAAADRLIEDGNRAEDNGDPRAACGHYRKAVVPGEAAPPPARPTDGPTDGPTGGPTGGPGTEPPDA